MSARRKSQRLQEIVGPKSEPAIETVQTSNFTMVESETTSISTAIASSQQNVKRPRDGDEMAVDEPPSKARQTHVKHVTHWALDGNWLLQFGDVRFKVHRSRLCSQSIYFQDLADASNGNINEENDWHAEIEDVVKQKEIIDGLECFFFLEKAPPADDFSALLDCIFSIDYIYDGLPDFETVKKIMSAADYFCFSHFKTFAVRYIKTVFPTDANKIQNNVSPHFLDGIDLGDRYSPVLKCIDGPAYYDLARQSFKEGSLTGPASHKGLSNLNLRKLVHLQRKLSEAWDEIIALLDVGGAKGPECCDKRHVPSFQTLLDVKKRYPFDPILGIRQLKSVHWISKKYCALAIASLKDSLQRKSRQIWADIPVWIQEVNDEPESDSNDSTNDESGDESTTSDGKD